MIAPARLRLSRVRGFDLQALSQATNGLPAIPVARPARYGNPFPWKGDWIVWAAVAAGFWADAPSRKAAAVAFHRAWLMGEAAEGPDAHTKSGGTITYESGVALDVAEAARGLTLIELANSPVCERAG